MPSPLPWSLRLRALAGSLKLRITLGAMLALGLGIGLSTLALVRQAERDTLSAMRERELVEVVRTATSLSRQVVGLQQGLQLTGRQLDAATLADDAALGRFLQSQVLLRDMFSGIYVIRADGRVRMAMTAEGLSHPTLDVSDRAYFQRSMREQRPIISTILPSRLSGEPLIVFSQPLFGLAETHGVLAGAMNLKKRDLLAAQVDADSVDTEVLRVISDADGRILAHPDPAMLDAPLSAEPRLAAALQRWKRAGSPVEPAGIMLPHEGELVSVAGVAGPDWLVWRAVDETELLAPLHAARRHALGWAGALVMLSSVVLLFGLWWLLRPLDRLSRRAEHLFDGTLTASEGWPATGGEIGRLTRVLQRVVSERAGLERANDELLRKLGSVMNHAPSGLAFTRGQRFELVSAEFCRLLRRKEAELLGQPAAIIYDSMADYEALGSKVGAAFAAGQAYVGEVRMRRSDGERFWAQLRGRPVDAGNSEAGTIWTVTDVTEQVMAREQLEWSASHDVLTGLANRKAFELRLARCFNAKPDNLPAAVVMVDLDHFKPINDRAGHAAGDAMLQAVAAALRSRVRTHDLAVRLGGDEFALLLEHCPHEAALHIAEAVRVAIAGIDLEWADQRLQVSASLGVASLSIDTPSVSAWLAAADEACYAAKAAGRGRIMVAPLRPALRVVASS